MSHAADLTLYFVVFICGIWINLIPLGVFIYFNSKAWRATDPTLPMFERFNQTIHATFWENILVIVIIIVLRKFSFWVFKKAKEIESK